MSDIYFAEVKREIEVEKDSYTDLLSDISRDSDEYLDLTLERETEFLYKYRAILEQ